MVAILDGKDDLDKLNDLSTLKYEHQAKWFMNAYWAKGEKFGNDEKKREALYNYCQNMIKMDPDGRNGCDLEQFKAHQFLEKNTDAITWTKMKTLLTALGLDLKKDKRVSLTNFLLTHYNIKDYKYLVNAVQNVDDKIQKKLDELKTKMDILQDKADEAAQAKREADEAHAEQMEAHEAVARILAEIKAFQKKLSDGAAKLQAIIDDESLSQVKRMKARHELNDLKSGARARRKGLKDKDPDWLRTAKIKQKAAVRREKAATKVAAAAAGHAAEAKYEADTAFENAQQAFDDLSKNSKGSGEATIWWMGRQLKDMKKYMSSKDYARMTRKVAKKIDKLKV
eukprot:g3839.t1